MALNDLLVHIGADISGLDSALKKAGAGLATFAKASAAAAVAVGGSLAAMTLSGLKLGNEIEILARRANATPEAFQRMAAGARRVGIDSEGLSDILQDVNDKIGDFMATGAGGMADFFENIAPRVGVTADMFKKLSGPQALQLYVSSLEKAGLNQQEMTFYMEALASETTSLLPLLRNGGVAMQQFGDEAQSAGQILSTDVLQSLKNADAAISRMGNVFITLRNQLAVEMAPILEKVANQFNELAQSKDVQDAISRLAVAFGKFAEAVLSDDFLQVAIDGLSGIANIAAGVAEGMVTLSQNVELVVVALGGIATAAVVMGGPLTAAAGAIALVLGGMALWKRYSTDMAEGSDTAKSAQQRLNEALELTPEAAKAAGIDIIKLANDNKKFAESALDAAEASLAQQEAMLAAEKTRLSQVNKDVGEGEYPVLGTANMLGAGVIEARQRLNAARAAVDKARQSQGQVLGQVIGSSYGDAELPTTLLRSDGTAITPGAGDDQGDVTIKPLALEPTAGVSSAEQLREQLEQRLEVLTEGLMTEREVVAQWYEEGQTVLEDALAKGLLTEEEYREQRERLEEEHQKRMNAIKQAGAASDLATVMGAGEQILSAIGQNNKKAMKIAKVFGAAQALISTYTGAAEALKLPFPKNLAAAAAIIAKGIGFVNAIKSVGDNGSGGGGAGSTGASATSSAAAPAIPTQTVAINLQGDTFSRSSVEGLLEQIQSQLDRGGRLVFQ